jgi:hypothetical protein
VAGTAERTGRPGVLVGQLDALTEPYNTPQDRRGTTYQASGSVSWVRGPHSFKAGLDVRRFELDFFLDLFARGSFTFVGLSGNAFADLLMGVPFVSLRQSPLATSDTQLRTTALNTYGQDEWKIGSDLTLNLGVRYEFNQPPYETANRFSVPDLATGAFVTAGSQGIPRAGFAADRNNIAPRLGLAWKPFGRSDTSVRGGYGMFYDVGILNLNTLPRYNPPQFSFDLVVGPRPLENAFASETIAFNQVNTIDPAFREAYYHQFSAGIQREVRRDLMVEAAYVGSRGRNLALFTDVNQGFPGGPLFPRPAFGPVISASSNGRSTYDALQVRLDRRFVEGFSLLASYTLSSSEDLASSLFGIRASSVVPQNSSDVNAEWGPSDFDTPHRLAVSTIWELPVGPGRRFLNDASGLSKVLSHWEVTSIVTRQSGRPFTVHYGPTANFSGTSNGSNGGPGRDRPNLVGDPQPASRTGRQWFDPTAFAPARGAFGSVGRNSLRGDSLMNVDLGVYRNGRIGQASVQFRVEVFNLFNTTHYSQPVSDLTSASAGQFTHAADARQVQFGLKLQF